MNQVALTGRLTRDVEVRYTQNDKAVANFTIATNRVAVRDGEEKTDFINCIVWGNQAENLAKYQGKGSLIGVFGKLQVRDFEDSKGNKRYITEVVVDSIEYLGTKKETTPEYDAVQNARRETDPFEEFGNNIKSEGNGIEISNSDLPF